MIANAVVVSMVAALVLPAYAAHNHAPDARQHRAAVRDRAAAPTHVARAGARPSDSAVVYIYRRYLATLDPSEPRSTLIASRFLSDRMTGTSSTTRDALVGEYLTYFESVRQAQTNELALMSDRREAYQRATRLHWELQPYGLTIESCEEQSHAAVEIPGFVLRRLRDIVTPVADEFLRLRETEVQAPLGPGCEGLPRADVSRQAYAMRRAALRSFLARHPGFALNDRVRGYLAFYSRRYGAYMRQFRE